MSYFQLFLKSSKPSPILPQFDVETANQCLVFESPRNGNEDVNRKEWLRLVSKNLNNKVKQGIESKIINRKPKILERKYDNTDTDFKDNTGSPKTRSSPSPFQRIEPRNPQLTPEPLEIPGETEYTYPYDEAQFDSQE